MILKRLFFVFILLLFISACDQTTNDAPLQQGLLIQNAQVLTADGAAMHKAVVVLEQGRIAYVGQKIPDNLKGYELLDASGKYLIPGLIDSHVHLTEVNGMNNSHQADYPELVNAFRTQLPRSYLYFGFTTLINLGASDISYLEVFENNPLAPDLYHSGSKVTFPGGYGMPNTDKEEIFKSHPNFLYLESQANRIPKKYLPENHSAEAVAARVKASGAIALKTYYEPGFGPKPNLVVPTQELMQSLVKATHAQDLILAAHGNSLEAHDFLTEAGVDIIVHGMWRWGDNRLNETGELPLPIKSALDKQIEKQIGYIPTLQVIAGLRSLAVENFLDDPELNHVLPESMLDWYRSDEGKWFFRYEFSYAPPEKIRINFARVMRQGQQATAYFANNNGKLLFGTDTPAAPTYGNPPGYNGYLEIKQMFEAGISLKAILYSATVANAKAFKLDHLYGSIEVGKTANLVLMNKNPLKDVSAYNAIDSVILKGIRIPRVDLSASVVQNDSQ